MRLWYTLYLHHVHAKGFCHLATKSLDVFGQNGSGRFVKRSNLLGNTKAPHERATHADDFFGAVKLGGNKIWHISLLSKKIQAYAIRL